jgi:hypothetical protein
MITIFLNGQWDFEAEATMQAYEVATAAMRLQFPKAYIFNPCKFLSQYQGEEQVIKREKVFDALYAGQFSHLLLIDDWWLWQSARHAIAELADGWLCGLDQKPVIMHMTEEMRLQGKEYLSKLQQAEHQSMRKEQEE